MKQKNKNSGFILILVLLVITIATLTMVTAGQNSCQRALMASRQMDKLQTKWAALSAKETLLNSAELFLLAQSTEQEQPLKAIGRMTLGKTNFDFIIYDEQAKANVNSISSDSRIFHEKIIRLQNKLPIVLNPVFEHNKTEKTNNKISQQRRYSGFEDLFGLKPLNQFVDTKQAEGLADRLTFWGNGKINFKRASQTVIKTVLSDYLNDSQIESLLELRRQLPDCTAFELADNMDLPRNKRRKLLTKITDQSKCYSLWIISSDPGCNQYRLFIKESGEFQSNPKEYSVIW